MIAQFPGPPQNKNFANTSKKAPKNSDSRHQGTTNPYTLPTRRHSKRGKRNRQQRLNPIYAKP